MTATRVACAFGVLVVVTAGVVHLAAADDTRRFLDFGFPGVSSDLGTAWEIFNTNARLLGAALVACLVAQITRPDPDAGRFERAVVRIPVRLCDFVLVAAIAFHIAYVGFAFGAYGSRVAKGVLPHGPVELGAFSLGLALYLAARRERLETKRFIGVGCTSVVGLAVASLLEVFVA